MFKFFKSTFIIAGLNAQMHTAFARKGPNDMPDHWAGIKMSSTFNVPGIALDGLKAFGVTRGEHLAGTILGSMLSILASSVIPEGATARRAQMATATMWISAACFATAGLIELLDQHLNQKPQAHHVPAQRPG